MTPKSCFPVGRQRPQHWGFEPFELFEFFEHLSIN